MFRSTERGVKSGLGNGTMPKLKCLKQKYEGVVRGSTHQFTKKRRFKFQAMCSVFLCCQPAATGPGSGCLPWRGTAIAAFSVCRKPRKLGDGGYFRFNPESSPCWSARRRPFLLVDDQGPAFHNQHACVSQRSAFDEISHDCGGPCDQVLRHFHLRWIS